MKNSRKHIQNTQSCVCVCLLWQFYMLEIINQQRKIKIETVNFQEFAEKAITVINEAKGKELTIAFVSDKKITYIKNSMPVALEQ